MIVMIVIIYNFILLLLLFIDEKVIDVGPIETDKIIRTDPYSLPPQFFWDNLDLCDSTQVWYN